MARRSSTINKTRLKEEIAKLKTAVAVLELEVTLLDPINNERHKMRLQSILGASVVMGIAEALGSVESAFRAVRTIRREQTHEHEPTHN